VPKSTPVQRLVSAALFINKSRNNLQGQEQENVIYASKPPDDFTKHQSPEEAAELRDDHHCTLLDLLCMGQSPDH
jgi:hypothetical protein